MPDQPKRRSERAGPRSGRRGIDLSPRLVFFVLACAVFAVSSWVAFRQPSRADPFHEPRPPSFEWFVTPIEHNAILGRPVIVGGLNAITGTRTANGIELWALGDGGMILSSTDGGSTWYRRDFLPPPAQPLQAAPVPAAGAADGRGNSGYGGTRAGTGAGTGAGSSSPSRGTVAGTSRKIRSQRDMRISSSGPAPPWALATAFLAEPPVKSEADAKANQADPGSNAQQETGGRSAEDSKIGSDGPAASSGRRAQSRQQPPQPAVPLDRTHNELTAISFSLDGRQGWVVGAGGIVGRSDDGGATWRQEPFPDVAGPASLIQSVYCAAAGNVWVVGGPGIRYLRDGRWAGGSDAGQDFTSVHGAGGQVFVTNLNGRGLNGFPRDEVAVVAGMRAVYALDARNVWAVGNGGRVRASSGNAALPDAWPATGAGTTEDLLAVHFVDARNGWAVGAHGAVVHTRDGKSWDPQTSGVSDKLKGEEEALRGVWFADARRGWAVGDGGIVIATTDGGAHWERITSEWHRSDPETAAGLRWELDDQHFLTWTNEAIGKTRRALDRPVLAFHFFGRTEGWAIEEGGTMRFTADGGKRWDAPPAYRWRPAPWYYAACVFALVLLVPTLRRPPDHTPKPGTEQGPSIADRLLSDQPLGPGDRDRLNFNEIALGIANFLRNSRTRPPLTLAVTGKWGSGKTSLMNLVRAELKRFGVRPVWFNAWHHQKEEHLLAALLENIRAQAVPPWYDPSLDGLMFHLRLLWARWSRYWPLVVLLLLGFGWSLGFFIEHPGRLEGSVNRVTRYVEWVIDLLSPGEKGEKKDADKTKPPANDASAETTGAASGGAAAAEKEPAHGLFLVFVTTSVTLLGTLRKGLKSFGADPGKLLASRSQHATVANLSEQAGFRYRFAREFREVTEALDPRTMLILIDDLDRCRPENVLEVMEAVNFLVSSGECFVILGMDADIVRRCIGLGFKGVAEEMAAQEELAAAGARSGAAGKAGPTAQAGSTQACPATQAADTAASLRARDDFARRYLEKLVAIQIEVPRATPVQLTDVAAAPEEHEGPAPGKWRTFVRAAAPSARAAAVVLLVAGMFSGAIGLGLLQFAPPDTAAAPATQPSRGPTDRSAKPPAEPPGRRDYNPGQTHGVLVDTSRPRNWAWVYVPAGVLLVLGLVASSLRPNIVIPDTERFTEAIDLWSPLLFADASSTPRGAKRFINRVRYLAMRQRPQESFRNAWQRLRAAMGRAWALAARRTARAEGQRANAPDPAPPGVIREDVLVALSAVRYYAARPLYDAVNLDGAIESLKSHLDQALDPGQPRGSTQQPELVERLGRLRVYVRDPGNLSDMKQALPRFLDISKGVSVN